MPHLRLLAARHLMALTLLAPAMACGDQAAPPSGTPYEWRLVIAGTPPDSLSFRWPRATLPVKIWVEDDSLGMPGKISAAIREWRAAFPSGEWRAATVADSMVADVIVRTTRPPPLAPPGMLRLGAAFVACEGATDIDTVATRFQLRLPVHAWVYPLDPGAAGLGFCLQAVATHELGHTLGIFQHSPAAADLMFTFPAVSAPSEDDLTTAWTAYHTPPDMVPVRP